ncbi:TspO/MBR family protein [Sphingomonas sp.]|uniref:TspO/MBR family protein n=1 Tax=Sphingomonas sp. TaxID=28214 RepID=UPI002DBB99D6|nr:TspO/MBR family protein [Sphingomonas sp.]HEU4969192.1 TspO/MBR family protein [Sphingomonas sp.]
MGEIASRSQIGFSLFRRAVITIPLVLLLGIASGRLAGSGYDNNWFAVLRKPEAMPPGAVFGLAWTLLYILQGLALAIVLNARGNRLRALAITLFVVQLALNLAWSPLFFAMHQVMAAFWLIAGIFVAALATTVVFGQIRSLAGWLMVPYLAWLCFAAALNHDIARMNPDAERLVPGASSTQIDG